MADIITDQIESTPITPIQQELADKMAIALNGGIEPKATILPEAEIVEPIIPNEPPPFTFDTLKEKFGYETPEAVLTEIEQLRAFKATQPAPEQKFENEQSEKLYKAFKSGKVSEVKQYLDEQDRLDRFTSQEINKDSASDIIKLGMQLKYKDLTQEEINYKFNKQFALPKQPIQDSINESDEDYEVRVNEWKDQVADIEMNKIIEAKLVKPDLENAKTKLVLPELENTVDEGYSQYLKMLEDNATLDVQTKEAYKSLTPKDVETKIPFTDEASKVKLDFQYQPDGESFKKAVEIVSDNDKFIKLFFNSDGTPNRKMFIDAVLYATNKQHIITEAIKQGSNARMTAMLPDNDNGGLIRHLPQEQQVNELDAQMKKALGLG